MNAVRVWSTGNKYRKILWQEDLVLLEWLRKMKDRIKKRIYEEAKEDGRSKKYPKRSKILSRCSRHFDKIDRSSKVDGRRDHRNLELIVVIILDRMSSQTVIAIGSTRGEGMTKQDRGGF